MRDEVLLPRMRELLQVAVSREDSHIDEVTPVRARQYAFLDSYPIHRAAVITSRRSRVVPRNMHVLRDRLFFQRCGTLSYCGQGFQPRANMKMVRQVT